MDDYQKLVISNETICSHQVLFLKLNSHNLWVWFFCSHAFLFCEKPKLLLNSSFHLPIPKPKQTKSMEVRQSLVLSKVLKQDMEQYDHFMNTLIPCPIFQFITLSHRSCQVCVLLLGFQAPLGEANSHRVANKLHYRSLFPKAQCLPPLEHSLTLNCNFLFTYLSPN